MAKRNTQSGLGSPVETPGVKFGAVVRDGRGTPIVGVRVRSVGGDRPFLDHSTFVSNANGEFALYMTEAVALNVMLTPPLGYEVKRSFQMPGPGDYNITLRRIVRVECTLPAAVRVRSREYVRGIVTFDSGEPYAGSADFTISSSDARILKTGTGGGDMYVEGAGVGRTETVCSYCDVQSEPRLVEVVE